MRAEILRLAAELAERGEPFALATVVRREAPSSARSGDVAIVTADGTFHGWVGGTCTRPTVMREARAALADGEPRLVALSPEADADRPGVRALPMTCHSGGSVDVHIDPVLPAPTLYVFGATPAARTLADLAAGAGWAVVAVDPDADADAFPRAERVRAGIDPDEEPERSPAGRYVVVATQGQWDEKGIRLGLSLAPDYLGVVASPRRFAEMRRVLVDRGEDADALARVDAPAGLDLGQVTPAEIAVGVLAGLVRHRRRAAEERASDEAERPAPRAERPEAAPEEAPVPVDPVCGMDVETGPGVPSAEYADTTYWFCCGGCRERFLADPEAYLEAAG